MTDTIITATLVRGKKYSYNQIVKTDAAGLPVEGKFHAFERNIPVPVSSELADELEELVEVLTTSDGDEVEKPRFKIDRSAPARQSKEVDPAKKVRMRLVVADAKVPAPRPKPKGLYGRKIGQ